MPGSPDPVIPEISVTDVWTALQQDRQAQLIDVRTRAEWAYVGTPDLNTLGRQALLVEWQTFPDSHVDPQFTERLSQAIAAVGGGRETELFFICRSGVRSLAAARAGAAAGFSRCRNVTGGFEGQLDADRHRGRLSGWKAAGMPWVRANPDLTEPESIHPVPEGIRRTGRVLSCVRSRTARNLFA